MRPFESGSRPEVKTHFYTVAICIHSRQERLPVIGHLGLELQQTVKPGALSQQFTGLLHLTYLRHTGAIVQTNIQPVVQPVGLQKNNGIN